MMSRIEYTLTHNIVLLLAIKNNFEVMYDTDLGRLIYTLFLEVMTEYMTQHSSFLPTPVFFLSFLSFSRFLFFSSRLNQQHLPR